ncbi:MAG: RNA 2',3'-cyclic phosphodiesterase, partial [Candidatus Omnitrophica bacterium]|nr:RNA 2',3'-cyclic phosphodiesterase [Candidatus Omnitrophota bacterium]
MKSSGGSSSHRVFIAVPLQKSSEPAYRNILQKFQKNFESARAIPFENAHLTLRFLSSVDDAGVQKLKDTLDGLSGLSSPFNVSWQRIGMFKFSNSVWVGPVHSEPLLNSLHRNICHAIHKAGFGLPDKRFRPHITFARFPARS